MSDESKPQSRDHGEHDVIVRVLAISQGSFGTTQYEAVTDVPLNLRPNGLGIFGVVVEINGSLSNINVNDEVLALLPKSAGTPDARLGSTVTTDASMVCRKPSAISFADSADLPLWFAAAMRVVRGALELPSTWPRTHVAEDTTPRRFCIFGGNSSIGASVMQILRHLFPESRIVTMIYGPTATEEDRRALLQDAFTLLRLGSSYAIDGADPESLDCLELDSEKPPEVVISFPHASGLDAEILSRFGEPRSYSLSEADVQFEDSSTVGDKDAIGFLGRLLKAEKFKVAFPDVAINRQKTDVLEVN